MAAPRRLFMITSVGAAERIIARVTDAPDRPDLHVIDIFMMSVKCGNCDAYQTIVKFTRAGDKNVYTYECENEVCDPNVTRTIVEVPDAVRQLDARAPRNCRTTKPTLRPSGRSSRARRSPGIRPDRIQ